MKENNNEVKTFAISGQPLPKPRMTKRGWFYKKYWEYLNSVSEIIWATMKHNGWKTMTKDVGLSLQFYRKGKKRADWDNLAKTIGEVLQKAKVIENDNQITRIEDIFIFYNQADPQTIIKVWEE